jgi:hypothetical protein
MEFAAELQASLREFTASGVVEVRENGGRVAPFSGMSWEVRGNGEKPLLHLWSDQFNLTRRLLAITDRSEERLALAVERFGRAKPHRLEFIRREFERGARELSREEFRDRLAHLLAEQFPDETLESLVSSRDLEHSFSGNYARGLLRRGTTHVAVLAVPGGESSDAASNSLTFALLWLRRTRESGCRGAVTGIRIILPKNSCGIVAAQSREVWLRFRGLPFARWDDGRVFFGINDAREELTPASRAALKHLVHDLEVHRHPLASDTRHSLYRLQPERWLESIVHEDVTRIDAMLDQRFVYAQVFVNAGGEHGILDLLTVTRSGRLAVIELKASEHIHLPLQAADYWLRVRRQLQGGEIARYGYFQGVALQQAPPLVYLVAPALRFHPATDDLLKYLSPELEVARVGLAESWRRGLHVVMRQ